MYILGAGCMSALVFALFAPTVPFVLSFSCGGGIGFQTGCPPFTYLNGFNSIAYTLFHIGASYSFQLGYETNLVFVGGGAETATFVFFLLPMVVIAVFLLRRGILSHRVLSTT